MKINNYIRAREQYPLEYLDKMAKEIGEAAAWAFKAQLGRGLPNDPEPEITFMQVYGYEMQVYMPWQNPPVFSRKFSTLQELLAYGLGLIDGHEAWKKEQVQHELS